MGCLEAWRGATTTAEDRAIHRRKIAILTFMTLHSAVVQARSRRDGPGRRGPRLTRPMPRSHQGRSVPSLYFYRTGFACTDEQDEGPGDEGWSGSAYCGDADGVIGAAQRLVSLLVPVQMAVEARATRRCASLPARSVCMRPRPRPQVLAMPPLTALADRWSYTGVVFIGAIAEVTVERECPCARRAALIRG